MSGKIVGATVGSTLPKPNLMQTDPTKGDYVKGKEEFIKQFTSSSAGSVCHVSYNLVNAISDNYISTVNKGDDFKVNLTALDGYAFTSVKIIHNGEIEVDEAYNRPITGYDWGIYGENSGVQGDIAIIAVAELVDANVDLTGYATEQYVKDYAQPKGNYLTDVPEGYAKTSDIPTKPEDIGAQPSGNYALKSEIPSVPVQSVNGKTGAVQLSAADVKARSETWMPSAQDVGALPNTYTPPNQTADQVGADPKGSAASAVSQHNTAGDSHNDIRLELKAINDRLTAFFDSDNQTLDELSEIVAYITSNKALIDSITTSKVSVADIINNLTTNVTNKPLSAAQGVVLKGLIDALSNSLSNYQPKGNYLTSFTETDPTVPSWAKAPNKPSYSKSDVGLGNVDNVKQYSATNPPPYPVTSVNGKTGDVTVPVPTKVSQLQNDSGFLTEISKEAIVQQVITALGTPVFGRVDADKNITLSGNLADGTYKLWFEDEDGKVTELCTYKHGAVENPNLLTVAVNESRQPFVGDNGEVGYIDRHRINSSNQVVAIDLAIGVTGYLPVKTGWTISFENMLYSANTNQGYRHKIAFYDENFAWIAGVSPTTGDNNYPTFHHNGKTSVEGIVSNGRFNTSATYPYLTQLTIDKEGVAYMRVCAEEISGSTVIKRVIE